MYLSDQLSIEWLHKVVNVLHRDDGLHDSLMSLAFTGYDLGRHTSVNFNRRDTLSGDVLVPTE